MQGARSFPSAMPDSRKEAGFPSATGREIMPSSAAAYAPFTQLPSIPYPSEAHPVLYPGRMNPTAASGMDWTMNNSSTPPATNYPALSPPTALPSDGQIILPGVAELPDFRHPPYSYPSGPSDCQYELVGGPSRTVSRRGSAIVSDLPRWHPYPRLDTRAPVIEQGHSPGLNAPRDLVQFDSPLPRELPTSTAWVHTSPDNFVAPLQSVGPSTPNDDKASVSIDAENGTGIPFLPEHPEWTLTSDLYRWIFAVLYPKKRPNKKIPTPTGACRLCRSDCKRPGILQQHVRVLHRQRLTRRVLAGQSYNLELALAFVVAEIRSTSPEQDSTPLVAECHEFLGLVDRPGGLGPLTPDKFPCLRTQLAELIRGEDWIGVQCKDCGMWATRQVALNEHTVVCTAKKRSDSGVNAEPPTQHKLRFTPTGLAVRPPRRRTPGS